MRLRPTTPADTDTIYIQDPEPWIHRWPNCEEGVRSEAEKCGVAGCDATHEPRSLEQLNKAPFSIWRLLWSLPGIGLQGIRKIVRRSKKS